MPLNKPIPDFVMHLWRRIRRFELTRTLRVIMKMMKYVGKSLADIDRVDGRIPKCLISLPTGGKTC